ncbi:aldolase [Siminovitchia sediminis]|uniref:Aldolase n=1 Tax=Siminovitchia sediminis TaxID=1274353 RepID=A0ABW4KLP8_9BACI
MTTTLESYYYKAFGFKIQSIIPLPELQKIPIHSNEEDIDIVVELDELSELWEETAYPNQYFSILGDAVLFHVPDIAIYRIQNGTHISISAFGSSSLDHIRLYLLGTCMGILLMQRRILPLHGSAIMIGGKAYAIVGESGAGKSTLASAFLQKGYQLISDDVIPVQLKTEGMPIVTPAYPQQKLWEESLQAFDMEPTNFKPIIDREKKFAVPVQSHFAGDPVELAGIYELIKIKNGTPNIVPTEKLDRLHTIFRHTYRNFLLGRLGLMEWHFQLTTQIIQKTDIYQLRRPHHKFTVHNLTAFILETIR